MPSVFIDWSDSTAVGMLLKGHRPSHVIIVPPGIDGTSSYRLDSTMWAAALRLCGSSRSSEDCVSCNATDARVRLKEREK